MNTVTREQLIYAATSTEVFPKKSDVAFVIGNGPSLRRYNADLYRLYKQKSPIVFAVNRIFLTSIKVPTHYYLALDKTMWARELDKIHRLKSLRYFVPTRYSDIAQVARKKVFSYAKEWCHFAKTWGNGLGHGRTSTYPCLQLAYMAGVKEVHIFGVDMRRDNDGKSHDGRNIDRDPRGWQWARQAMIVGMSELEKNGVECVLHSDLFES